MAQSYSSSNGTMFIPGARSTYSVRTDQSGLATNGTIVLFGEADSGPDFTTEIDLEDNAFGPDQSSAVIAKYGSGNLVDAYLRASVPSKDPRITGSPAKFILVKTNAGTKAEGALLRYSGSYSGLQDTSYGQSGNLIYYSVAASTSEIEPTTGTFTFIPAVGTVNASLRVSGAAIVSLSLGAAATPATLVSTAAALTGINATGGALRTTLTVSGTIALVASGNNVTITRSVAWTTTPVIGDTLMIPASSIVAGASDQNVGAYVITAATTTTLTATKLSDAAKSGAVIGTVTAPANDSGSVGATTDLAVYSPVTLTLDASDPVDGIGKTLEINELTTGTDLLTRTCFALGTTNAVTWVSTSAVPAILTSAAEYKAKLLVNRNSTNTREELTAGGDVVLKVAYVGTTAALTVGTTTLTSSVTGGTGGNLSLTLADFSTISDLATYINAQPGYIAAVGNAVLGQLPTSAIDKSVYNIGSTWGSYTGRIKADGYKMAQAVNQSVAPVEFDVDPVLGLPKVQAIQYLSGGAKGGTLAADITAALLALESVGCNFIVPLFSRDASADIAAGLTESSSTYDIDAIGASCLDHVTRMSTFLRGKKRQAVVSFKGSFTDAKEFASNIGSFRVATTFQDFKQVNSLGLIAQYQPWMGAALAAGMQSAAFYKGIVKKQINTSGVVMGDGSFNPKNDSQLIDALQSGLLPAGPRPTGTFEWKSDQNTYGADDNYVFNSLQAVYCADIISQTTQERMENTIVGESTGDINAQIALGAFEATMADFLRLKLISPSDDAPKGYKNVRIVLNGNALEVRAEIKLSTLIYFVAIDFTISKVQQTA